MLICEELHLLLTEPSGKTPWYVGTKRRFAEIAALVMDLMLAGRVRVTDDRTKRVQVLSHEPTGDPVLDGALATLARHDGKAFTRILQVRAMDPKDAVVEALVARGILDRSAAGPFGGVRTPERDPMVERRLRERLAAVLAGTAEPSVADATLLSLVQALDAAHVVLKEESAGLGRSALKKRIREIAEHAPAADAVTAAVQELAVVIMTTTMLPMIAAGGAASS